VDLIGGDTTASNTGLVISVTALGEQEKIKLFIDLVLRMAILVSGDLGAAYMGLQILEREKRSSKQTPNSQPDIEAYSYLIERQLKPEAKDILSY
jgi:thiamine-monophosphate kinase